MSQWREHRDKILEEIGRWASHPRDPDSTSRGAIVSALNDAELSINEAAKAEEEKSYMNGKG